MTSESCKYHHPHIIALIFVVVTLLTGSLSADFPLNDDWNYARVTYSIVEEGRLIFPTWGAPTLIIQALWGAIFCLPFGFSFIALKLSTLTLAIFSIYGIYQLLIECGRGVKIAFYLTIFFVLSPMYLMLSQGFMTDVPFLSFIVYALLFFVRYMKSPSIPSYLAAIVFTLCAVLTRQIALVVPLAFMLCMLIREKWTVRKVILICVPFVSIVAFFLLYEHIMDQLVGLPVRRKKMTAQIIDDVTNPSFYYVGHVITMINYAFIYLGFFMIPLVLLKWWQRESHMISKRVIFLFMFFVFGQIALLIVNGRQMPMMGNMIHLGGMGPVMLADVFKLKTTKLPEYSHFVWSLLTVLSVLASAFFMTQIVLFVTRHSKNFRKAFKNHRVLIPSFMTLSAIFYFTPLALAWFFDRYVLYLVFIALFSLNFKPTCMTKKTSRLFILAMLPYLIFSLAETHHFISWNKARWQAVDYLVNEKNIDPQDIDGGFEVNGWHETLTPDFDGQLSQDWQRYDRIYSITMGSREGYIEEKEYSCFNFLHGNKTKIYILRKLD